MSLACGAADAIASVVEDRTCHYRVAVIVTALCHHPAFTHRRPPTRHVTCTRQDGSGDDGGGDDGSGGGVTDAGAQ